jgi:hypothetical protein
MKTNMVTKIIHRDFQTYLTGRLGLVALNLPLINSYDRDRMVVGFTTTSEIGAYHH